MAVVTGDLDGFRTFYEDTIGLETTMVFGGGAGHSRQAVLMAGDGVLHVFEVADYRRAATASLRRCSNAAGSTTWASRCPTWRR